MRSTAEQENFCLPPVRLAVKNEIPMAGGLGSSAAAVVAGVKLASTVCGKTIADATVLRYAEVRLRISDGQEFREWPARVAFTTEPLKRVLLGFAGFLQFFTATFDGDREEVELTINAKYPGT